MAFAAAGKGGTGDVHNLLNWFKTTNVYRNTGRYTAIDTGKDKATRTNFCQRSRLKRREGDGKASRHSFMSVS